MAHVSNYEYLTKLMCSISPYQSGVGHLECLKCEIHLQCFILDAEANMLIYLPQNNCLIFYNEVQQIFT